MRTRILAVLATALLSGCIGEVDELGTAPNATAAERPSPKPAPVQPPAVQPPPVVTPPPAATPDAGPSVVVIPPAGTGSLSVTLPSSSVSLHLNETRDVKLTVTPSNGFNGTATFAVSGLPTGVTASFNPSSAALSTSPLQVTMTLHSISEALGKLGSPLTVTTTAGTISSSTPLTLDVLQEVIVAIAPGVDLGTTSAPNTAAFGAVSIPVMYVAPGTKVTFINLDSRTHEIHAGTNPTGLEHESGSLMPNGANTYSQILQKGTVNFRCHIHPNMLGQIVVR